ncbi:MAG: hypothetical protein P4L53_14915 [Candidatus Obscuribacterales bacterium]|nr:hypothetical protein [Candidatus Obscuribacterales bacterium]
MEFYVDVYTAAIVKAPLGAEGESRLITGVGVSLRFQNQVMLHEMKSEIARLIDDKAKQLTLSAQKRRNFAAMIWGVLAGAFMLVARACFGIPISTVILWLTLMASCLKLYAYSALTF